MANIYTHIATAATTTIASRPCTLHTVTLNEASAGAITVNDGTAAIAIIAAATAAQTFIYDVACKTDLSVVTAEADDVTVSHSPAQS